MKILKYGFGASALLILTFTITYSFDWYKSFRHTAITILELAILISATYLYMKAIIKKKYTEGIKFGSATIEGLKVVLTVAIATSLYHYLFFTFNEDAYLRYKKYTFQAQIEAAKNADFGPQQLKEYSELMEKELNPFNFAKINFIIVTLLGLVFVLILAAILRSKDSYPSFNNPETKIE